MGKKKTPKGKKKPTPQELEQVKQLENGKREAFCRHYAQGEGTFGNATLSYAAAYDIELLFVQKTDRYGNKVEEPVDRAKYHVCSASGSRLLRNAEILARVQELRLELFKDEVVDAELVKVIQQDEERAPKVQAIREFNKLRGRIIDLSKDLSARLPFGQMDLSAIISSLPPERQDYFYGVIADLIKEAELSRSSSPAQSSGTGNA